MSSSSSEPIEHTKQVQAIQDLMQDTGGASDDSDAPTSSGDETEKSSGDGEKKEHEENEVASIMSTAVCSGDGGCGETFSFDAPGSDFEYAMLCGSCYNKLDQQQSSTIRDEVTDITAVDTNDASSDDEVVEVTVNGKHSDDNEYVSTAAENDTGRGMLWQQYSRLRETLTGKVAMMWKWEETLTTLTTKTMSRARQRSSGISTRTRRDCCTDSCIIMQCWIISRTGHG
jgi:hypothetical protein